MKKKIKISSTQQQVKRETAKAWYDRLQRSPSPYYNHAYNLKKQGFTYCEIMDYFTGMGYK